MAEGEEKKIPVVVAIDFSDEIMESLRAVSDQYDIQQHFPDVPDEAWKKAEILYTVRDFPEPAKAPNLRWIQVNYAGTEGAQDRPIVQMENIELTSASGIHARQMANYCLMMILNFHYQLPAMMRDQNERKWREDAHQIYRPPMMKEQILGIVGYGSIGRELARIANALGMTVLASKRDLRQTTEVNEYSEEGTGDREGEIPERMYPSEAIQSLVKECDYIVLTVPLTDETRHMINEEVLDVMKPNAVIINVARGGVVDEKALIEALREDKIRGAGLDVFEEEPLPEDSPLWGMQNVVITPHVSGNSANYHEKAAALFRENLERYLTGKPLLNHVDLKTGY